jgi:hypothetical protein
MRRARVRMSCACSGEGCLGTFLSNLPNLPMGFLDLVWTNRHVALDGHLRRMVFVAVAGSRCRALHRPARVPLATSMGLCPHPKRPSRA